MKMISINWQKPRVMLSVSLALVAFLNSSCHPPVKIKDEIFTTSLGENGGQDVDMLTGEVNRITFQIVIDRWKSLDNIQVMTPLTTIQDLENELAQLCTDYQGGCTQTQEKSVSAVILKMKMIQESARKPY